MDNFRIEIASVPDREKLVAEIWFGEKMVAEINQENENLEIELYFGGTFLIEEFLETLEVAKRKLSEKE